MSPKASIICSLIKSDFYNKSDFVYSDGKNKYQFIYLSKGSNHCRLLERIPGSKYKVYFIDLSKKENDRFIDLNIRFKRDIQFYLFDRLKSITLAIVVY